MSSPLSITYPLLDGLTIASVPTTSTQLVASVPNQLSNDIQHRAQFAVNLMPLGTNTGTISIGGSTTALANMIPLVNGVWTQISVSDPSFIFIAASASGQKLFSSWY